MPELSCEQKLLEIKLEMENWKHFQDERDKLRDAGEKLYPVPEDAYWRHCERVLEIIEDM